MVSKSWYFDAINRNKREGLEKEGNIEPKKKREVGSGSGSEVKKGTGNATGFQIQRFIEKKCLPFFFRKDKIMQNKG